jgi:hypothetical protein
VAPAPQLEPRPAAAQSTRWTLATRIAFRFCFVYIALFCLSNQILLGLFPIPNVDLPALASFPPFRPLVLWTAAHLFHVSPTPLLTDTGSGDRVIDWVLAFCLLVISIAATALWSALDRKRTNYTALFKWSRLLLRFALVGQMLEYGFAKLVPLQMPFPRLAKLIEPFGNLSPMGVLWSSIGASPAYEMFAGSAETLAAILLIFPSTTMLGALVCLADMIQVFMLNMTYDVPVKLLSFHLILMSLLLLAPDFKRVTSFFFSRDAVSPPADTNVFRAARSNRRILNIQVVFGVLLIAANAWPAIGAWRKGGGGSPTPPLYGIWEVTSGAPNTERKVLFDRMFNEPQASAMAVQHVDEKMTNYRAEVNTASKTIALTKPSDKAWKASLKFQRPDENSLTLEGQIDDHPVNLKLHRTDLDKLNINRGFHWVQDRPFNR